MDDAARRFLSLEYGWTVESVQTVHRGENDTFLVTTGGCSFVVRRYRARHRSAAEVAAELAWLELLRGFLNVPKTVPTRSGTLYCTRGGRVFTVSEAVPGSSIFHPSPADYEHLGALQRELHEVSRALGRQPEAWPGHARPVYDLETLVAAPLRALQAAPFLARADKVRSEKIAASLTHSCGDAFFADVDFVHMDLHFGNIIVTNGGWFVLDFDECGFGPSVLDLGAVRFHAAFEKHLGEHYAAFLSGYGAVPAERVLLGSAVRAFYAAGKVPERLDIAGLAENPAGVVRRYLAFAASAAAW